MNRHPISIFRLLSRTNTLTLDPCNWLPRHLTDARMRAPQILVANMPQWIGIQLPLRVRTLKFKKIKRKGAERYGGDTSGRACTCIQFDQKKISDEEIQCKLEHHIHIGRLAHGRLAPAARPDTPRCCPPRIRLSCATPVRLPLGPDLTVQAWGGGSSRPRPSGAAATSHA